MGGGGGIRIGISRGAEETHGDGQYLVKRRVMFGPNERGHATHIHDFLVVGVEVRHLERERLPVRELDHQRRHAGHLTTAADRNDGLVTSLGNQKSRSGGGEGSDPDPYRSSDGDKSLGNGMDGRRPGGDWVGLRPARAGSQRGIE